PFDGTKSTATTWMLPASRFIFARRSFARGPYPPEESPTPTSSNFCLTTSCNKSGCAPDRRSSAFLPAPIDPPSRRGDRRRRGLFLCQLQLRQRERLPWE